MKVEARTGGFHPEAYDKVLIDGTNFINPIPGELLAGIGPEKLYISKSFVAECELLKPCMTQAQRAVLEQNLTALGSMVSKNRILTYAEDTWGNLCQLSQKRGRFLMITSNRLLVQKIILRQLQVDVYDLHDMEFLPASGFAAMQDRYRCQFDRMGESSQKLQKNILVYRKDRTIAALKPYKNDDGVDTSGVEAAIYVDPDRDGTLVKILKPEYRTAMKLENIRNLQELQEELQCPWAAFPVELVYRDWDMTQVLGFVMPAFTGASLEDWSNHVCRYHYQFKFSKVLLWCRMIASQVAYLGIFGICISDFNKQNFLLSEDRTEIPMLDTDSFNLGSYYGNRTAPEAGPALRSLSREGAWNKADIIDLCQERLYELLFMLLSETAGETPEDGWHHPLVQIEKGPKVFVANDPNKAALFSPEGERRYLFPEAVWNLMERVFTQNAPLISLPSPDALLYALLETEKKLAEDPEQYDRTYVQLREQFRRGEDWPINGLGADPEPPRVEEPPTKVPDTDKAERVAPEPAPKPRTPPRRRRIDYENPFAPARLMGLSIRHPDPTLPENRKHAIRPNIGNGQVDRDRQQQLNQAAEQAAARARKLRRRRIWMLVLVLMLVLTAGLVWLLCFSQSDLALRVQELAAQLAQWWEEYILPLWAHPRVPPGNGIHLAA